MGVWLRRVVLLLLLLLLLLLVLLLLLLPTGWGFGGAGHYVVALHKRGVDGR